MSVASMALISAQGVTKQGKLQHAPQAPEVVLRVDEQQRVRPPQDLGNRPDAAALEIVVDLVDAALVEEHVHVRPDAAREREREHERERAGDGRPAAAAVEVAVDGLEDRPRHEKYARAAILEREDGERRGEAAQQRECRVEVIAQREPFQERRAPPGVADEGVEPRDGPRQRERVPRPGRRIMEHAAEPPEHLVRRDAPDEVRVQRDAPRERERLGEAARPPRRLAREALAAVAAARKAMAPVAAVRDVREP